MQSTFSLISGILKRISANAHHTPLSDIVQSFVSMAGLVIGANRSAAIYKREGRYLRLQCHTDSAAFSPQPAISATAPGDFDENPDIFRSSPEWHPACYQIEVDRHPWGHLVVWSNRELSDEETAGLDLVNETLQLTLSNFYAQRQIELQQSLQLAATDEFADLSEFMPHIVRMFPPYIHFDSMLLTVPNRYLPSDMQAYASVPSSDLSVQPPYRLPFIHSKTEIALLEQTPRIEDFSQPQSEEDLAVAEYCRYQSILRLPVTHQGEPVAVFHFYSSLPEHYSDNEIKQIEPLMRVVAGMLMPFVHMQQNRIKQLFQTISSRLNEEILLSDDLFHSTAKISKMTRKLLHFDHMLTWFVDSEQLILKSANAPQYDLNFTDSDVISGFLFHKKTIFFNDIHDLNWISDKLGGIRARSSLLSPILDARDNHIIGVILLADGQNPYRFNQHVSQLCDDLIATKGGPIANLIMRKNLERSNLTIIKTLAIALDKKDSETQGHSERVVSYSLAIARQMNMSEAQYRKIRWGALLHDIGKIGIPDAILLKPGKLTLEEWEIMRMHPVIGFEMVKDIEFLEGAVDIVLYHHERYDGKGYPHGLKKEEIPLGARIFAIADAFDAITSDRPYRKAMSVEQARDIISECAGKQFCPECTEAFLSLPVETLSDIRLNYDKNFIFNAL